MKTADHRAYAPHGEGWRKAPSVTTGGCAHFWTRRNPATDQREWYCWDRQHKTWIFSTETQ